MKKRLMIIDSLIAVMVVNFIREIQSASMAPNISSIDLNYFSSCNL
jgi:hypothetical protein